LADGNHGRDNAVRILPIVLYVHLGAGVCCALALTVAILPRVWGSPPEERRLAAVCIACVPAWPLVVAGVLLLQSECVVELLTKPKDGE